MIALILLACSVNGAPRAAGVACIDGHPHIRWESDRAEHVAWVTSTPPFVTSLTIIGDGCDEVIVAPHSCSGGTAIVGFSVVSGPMPECVP
jgi:hypothetical protein